MKNEPNYRIFRVEIDSSDNHYDMTKKIVMKRFYAKTDEDAYSEFLEYKKLANKDYSYYVEYWTPIKVVRNGKTYSRDDDNFNLEFKCTMFEEVKSFFEYWFCTFPSDIWYKIRTFFYLIRTTHTYSSSWSIDDRILDVLEFNLPILKKNKPTLSNKCLDEALIEKYGKDIDLKSYHASHICGYPSGIENRAVELEHEMIDQLLEDIKLYRYYLGGYHEIDKMDHAAVEFDKKWRHTLPLKKGSYDRYDYEILSKMCDKRWNKICAAFQKYGRELNS